MNTETTLNLEIRNLKAPTYIRAWLSSKYIIDLNELIEFTGKELMEEQEFGYPTDKKTKREYLKETKQYLKNMGLSLRK